MTDRIEAKARELCILADHHPDQICPDYGPGGGYYHMWELYREQAQDQLEQRKRNQIRFAARRKQS